MLKEKAEGKAKAEYKAKYKAEAKAKAKAEYKAKAEAEYKAKSKAEAEAKAEALLRFLVSTDYFILPLNYGRTRLVRHITNSRRTCPLHVWSQSDE